MAPCVFDAACVRGWCEWGEIQSALCTQIKQAFFSKSVCEKDYLILMCAFSVPLLLNPNCLRKHWPLETESRKCAEPAWVARTVDFLVELLAPPLKRLGTGGLYHRSYKEHSFLILDAPVNKSAQALCRKIFIYLVLAFVLEASSWKTQCIF